MEEKGRGEEGYHYWGSPLPSPLLARPSRREGEDEVLPRLLNSMPVPLAPPRRGTEGKTLGHLVVISFKCLLLSTVADSLTGAIIQSS
jgi:hypothetical protein